MSKYLVKMTPLEPYSLGSEQGFKYPGEEKLGKKSYFARSEYVPSQTTILGMLRYLVLQDMGLFRASFVYSEEEKGKIDEAIGPDSYKFNHDDSQMQSFGSIQSVSPVFIIKGEEFFVKNPFNNAAESVGYEPYHFGEELETSVGRIQMIRGYDVKKGIGTGYISLKNQEIISNHDLFKRVILTGNRKNNKEKDGKSGFFKREAIQIKKGFSFAVYVDAANLPEKSIGFMGKKKSAFSIECVAKPDDDQIENKVKSAFADSSVTCYYALSDLYALKSPNYTAACIVREKYQRNLQTDYEKKRFIKNSNRINLIEAGSVFYQSDIETYFANANAKNIGYNSIVKIGG